MGGTRVAAERDIEHGAWGGTEGRSLLRVGMDYGQEVLSTVSLRNTICLHYWKTKPFQAQASSMQIGIRIARTYQNDTVEQMYVFIDIAFLKASSC